MSNLFNFDIVFLSPKEIALSIFLKAILFDSLVLPKNFLASGVKGDLP